MANVKIYKRHFGNFFIFAKIRLVRTIVTDTHIQRERDTHSHTHTHINRQAHSYRRNVADLPKNCVEQFSTGTMLDSGNESL